MANIISTHKSYNREVLTQRSVVKKGHREGWRLSVTSATGQGQHDWGSNYIKQYLQDSRATSIIWMHIEWALESYANSTTIISMSRKWNLFSTYGKVRPYNNAYFKGSYQSACSTERRPEPTQVVKPLELLWGDGATSSNISHLSNQRGKRTASELSLWHAPSGPQAC